MFHKSIFAIDWANYGLQYASPELQADREVVMTAVKNAGSALQFASGSLKADPEIITAANQANEKLRRKREDDGGRRRLTKNPSFL